MSRVLERAARGERLRAIGLMSGTSLDGIDAALTETDGVSVAAVGAALTLPYTPAFRDRLRALLGHAPEPSWQPVIEELTDLHAEAVRRLLAAAGLGPGDIDVVGFHGQTVQHAPEQRRTHQIGAADRLAAAIGIAVVSDFRAADVAAGGEGAPLVPLYHVARARELEPPLAVLNVGGVANLTWIGVDLAGSHDPDSRSLPPLLAFDTGPGNALLDDWCRARIGQPFDADGQLAAAGRIDSGRVMAWLRQDYFWRTPPKSLDRDAFDHVLPTLSGHSPEDGAATLTAFTARAVAFALPFLPQAPWQWLVSGGGRHNPTLLVMLQAAVGAPVRPVEAVGWRGDFVEAEAFAFLAVRSLRGLPLSVPATTRVPEPLTGGRLFLP